MHKLDYLQQKKLNPTDDLRALLKELEDGQPRVKNMNPTQALITLRNLDQIQNLFNQLEPTEADITAEKGRFEAIQTHLKQNVFRLLKALGGPAALRDYRPTPAPPRERWWWYMHEMVAEQQKRKLKQIVTIGGVLLAFLVGLFVLFNTVLAPSPEALARAEAEHVSLDAYEQGDYEGALIAVEEALETVPGDPGILILKGVFLEALDREDEAVIVFDESRTNLNDPANFYIGRGQIYLRTGQPVKAEQDARTALDVDGTLARAWLLLGQSLEFQGKRFEAIPAYQQAGEFALANGDDQVVVMARLALGRINVAAP